MDGIQQTYTEMQAAAASWRIREEQRKQMTIDAARRRAVEVNDISFPSLASENIASQWGVAPLVPQIRASAEKWTSGAASTASYLPSSNLPTKTTSPSPKRSDGRTGLHASISAAVRRTTQHASREEYDDYGDEYSDRGNAEDSDDGWTEVSSRAAPKAKRSYTCSRQDADDYFDNDGADFGSEEYEENR